ncbi:acyl-CoA thioesterase [Trujillonella endophytica]|uniref:Acyl-CoA thioesterase 2 n=1 Tax=Trujillonella endophytica TaxID=673521 RepID=A0A1H8U037_9ACTN|nr:acyl-CoA thioesterase domain-containing protein [Trujillella endophytica]SEO96541.1 acyl-CoA thioesterase-2 [Trujillella endophytica]
MTAPAGDDDLAELLQVLDLEEREPGVYVGQTPKTTRQRVFGGQVAGQALMAAELTTTGERPVHSLHSYFLRPGDPNEEIRYVVERIRDGRTFSTRRVLAHQHRRGEDVAIFALTADFHRPEPPVTTHSQPMPAVPPPDAVPSAAEYARRHDRVDPEHLELLGRVVEQRPLDDPFDRTPKAGPDARAHAWFRVAGRLPDDPTIHAAALTFVTDLTLLSAGLARIGGWDDRYQGASLDHAVWFHAPMRADEWFLYETDSPVAAGSRALCFGQIWSVDGTHVASVAQEGLIRDTGE